METVTKGPQATNQTVAVVEQPAVAKTRLFWRKSCDSIKDSTLTVIKEGEVFTKTDASISIPGEGEGAPLQVVSVYSLKRGKRMYYTPYVSKEQAQAAEVKAQERATADAKAKEEKETAKAKKAEEKSSKTESGEQAAAVTGVKEIK